MIEKDLFQKFIIEDNCLILGKVANHLELVTNKALVKSGGLFSYVAKDNMIVFYGCSTALNDAKIEDIKRCILEKKVFNDKQKIRNISERHIFGYHTGSEYPDGAEVILLP